MELWLSSPLHWLYMPKFSPNIPWTIPELSPHKILKFPLIIPYPYHTQTYRHFLIEKPFFTFKKILFWKSAQYFYISFNSSPIQLPRLPMPPNLKYHLLLTTPLELFLLKARGLFAYKEGRAGEEIGVRKRSGRMLFYPRIKKFCFFFRPAYVKRFTAAVSKELNKDTTDVKVKSSLRDESSSVARDPTGEFLRVASEQEECK